MAQTQAPRSGHGCLFGCLTALGIVLLPVLLVSVYSAWFFYQGFRQDPVLRAASQLLRRDGTAELVLGENIRITGLSGNGFSFIPGWGSHSVYDVSLTGSKASGDLAVEADVNRGRVHIDAMILTGPDGTRYDLMHHTLTPSGGSTTAI